MNITFIGAGRVATAVSQACKGAGHVIDLVISRSSKSAGKLAGSLDCAWSQKYDIPASSDIVIISVNDDEVANVVSRISRDCDFIIAHTAGGLSMDILKGGSWKRAVIYPLQTFSPGRKYDFREIPVFIEGENSQITGMMNELATSISDIVLECDSRQRAELHVAAVFVCNFVNHLLCKGEEIAIKAGFSFDIMKPLIDETFRKAIGRGPQNSQTGPAVRNDMNTIEKHKDLLSYSPELKQLYTMLSESIINSFKNNK